MDSVTAIRAVAFASALAVGGCASMQPQSFARPVAPNLMVGAMARTTAFERNGAPEPATEAGRMGPKQLTTAAEDQRAPADRHQRARTIAFWTGITAIVVGGAALVALGATGESTQLQLDKEYKAATVSRHREDVLSSRGKLLNKLAAGAGALTIVGLAAAVISYGIDYSLCGKLSRRRRKTCSD